MNLKQLVIVIVVTALYAVMAAIAPLWVRWGLLGISIGILFNMIENKRNR